MKVTKSANSVANSCKEILGILEFSQRSTENLHLHIGFAAESETHRHFVNPEKYEIALWNYWGNRQHCEKSLTCFISFPLCYMTFQGFDEAWKNGSDRATIEIWPLFLFFVALIGHGAWRDNRMWIKKDRKGKHQTGNRKRKKPFWAKKKSPQNREKGRGSDFIVFSLLTDRLYNH